MLGIDRKAARYTWTAVLILLLVALIYTVRSTLFVFVVALLFAYLLHPLVAFLDRLLPAERTRELALALAYVIFIAGVVLIGVRVGLTVVDQAQLMAKDFPAMLQKWEAEPASPDDLKAQILHNVRNEVARRANDLVHLLPAAGIRLMSVASDLMFIFIVPILGFFFLKDAGVIREHMLSLVDDGVARGRLEGLFEDVHHLLAHYMRALVLLSLVTFVSYTICFTILGVPFGVLLGVLAMMLEFIPMIGPLTAVVIILLVSLIAGVSILPVLAFLALFRVVQDYVISPQLMGQGVELHPLLVLFGVFAGAEVAGVAGSFLSVPLLALARVFYFHLRRSRRHSEEPSVAR